MHLGKRAPAAFSWNAVSTRRGLVRHPCRFTLGQPRASTRRCWPWLAECGRLSSLNRRQPQRIEYSNHRDFEPLRHFRNILSAHEACEQCIIHENDSGVTRSGTLTRNWQRAIPIRAAPPNLGSRYLQRSAVASLRRSPSIQRSIEYIRYLAVRGLSTIPSGEACR